jgi:hypothetical protein
MVGLPEGPQHSPRTADRLVALHQRSLNPDVDCLSESVSEPTEEEVQKLFISVWPKLRCTLRSRESLALFIELLTSRHERGETDRDILMLNPLRRRFSQYLPMKVPLVKPSSALLPLLLAQMNK